MRRAGPGWTVAAALALASRAAGMAGAPSATGFEESVASAFGAAAPAARFRLSAGVAGESAVPVFAPEELARAARGAMLEDAGPPEPARKPKWIWIGAASAVAVIGSAWNSFGEDDTFPWHLTNEGWFGRDTYAGGADKASHFTNYFGVTRLLYPVNRAFGLERDRAALVAAGVSALAGLTTEIGDATNRYGFSYEDIVMDWLGAATALGVLHYQAEDLVGFRTGLVPAPRTRVFGLGKDYSVEIYTADLKLAGLGRRLGFETGPARFLLVSLTYGVKGYPYADRSVRQRQVGIELGVNFGEVMKALGVPPDRWWGIILYTLFDVVRVPFTAWGFRYDLNHKTWYGPDTGDRFPNPGYLR